MDAQVSRQIQFPPGQSHSQDGKSLPLRREGKSFVEADKRKGRWSPLSRCNGRRKLEGIGCSQVVGPQEAPGALAQDFLRLNLLPISREKIKAPKGLAGVSGNQGTFSLQPGYCGIAFHLRSPPGDDRAILSVDCPHAPGCPLLHQEGNQGGAVPEPQRPFSRSSRSAFRISPPLTGLGGGLFRISRTGIPLPLRRTPARSSLSIRPSGS